VVEGERHEPEALRGGDRRRGVLVARERGTDDDDPVAALELVVRGLAVAGEVDGDRRARREDGALLEGGGGRAAGEGRRAGDRGQRGEGGAAADGGGQVHRGLQWRRVRDVVDDATTSPRCQP
jgi:hypothetical protein